MGIESSDIQLLRKVADRDRRALAELFDRHASSRLLSLVSRTRSWTP
jgi:hypothetical protein